MDNICARDKKLNLEQLLKLKRFERPHDQYWEKFEQELHEKTLLSFVKRKPWYARQCEYFQDRRWIPFGFLATATFVFCCISYQPTSLQSILHINAENQVIAERVPAHTLAPPPAAVSEMKRETTPEAIMLSEPSFVVAAFTAEPEINAHFTTVAVSKNMPKVNSSNIHYIAGNAFSHSAAANTIQ